MTQIPGTNYQISGNTILSLEGKEVSPQQFLEKVQNKEISLTKDSLQVLEGLGPDMMKSLQSLSGFPSSPGTVLHKLEDTDIDINSLMKLMHEVGKTQRESVSKVRDGQFDSQIEATKQSIEEDKKAAVARLVSGVFSGVGSMLAGGAGIGGGLVGTDQGMTVGKGIGDVIEGVMKIVSSSIDKAGSDNETRSKEWDIKAKQFEQQTGESRDLLDVIRETNSKVKEILQQTQSTEAETMRSINRM
jgi:hypothetical protein